MTTQTIEVEGLPEGWKAVAYRKPIRGERVFNNGVIKIAPNGMIGCWLIVEKIQPRRVVLEEVEHGTHEVAFTNYDGCWTYWRYVKENDLSLTNAEPKLSLSVEQCKKFFNGTITDRLEVFQLVEDFIKDK